MGEGKKTIDGKEETFKRLFWVKTETSVKTSYEAPRTRLRGGDGRWACFCFLFPIYIYLF